MLVSGRRIEDVTGPRAPLILLTIEDITERKDEEIAFARLAAIVECSDDAIIATTLDGVIETWNRGAERLYGYRAGKRLGSPSQCLCFPNRSSKNRPLWSASVVGSISIITNPCVGARMGGWSMSP